MGKHVLKDTEKDTDLSGLKYCAISIREGNKPYLTDCIAEENVRAPFVTKIEAITDFVGFG